MKNNKILVCGGGHQGLAMTAHLSLSGVDTTLWNRTREHIQDIIEKGYIKSVGVVAGTATPMRVSSQIEDVMSDVIMVTAPASATKDIAELLAPYVNEKMVIVLNPGRTFGAFEFAEVLMQCGVREMPHIAETQSIVYTCRRDSNNSVEIFALKKDIGIASLRKNDIEYILSRIPECLRSYFKPVTSIMETSMSNVGMILHCAPVLMNIGWIESPKTDFKYYYDGISESVAHFLDKIDKERIDVAKECGYSIESVQDWLKRIYGASGNSLFECIRNTKPYNHIDAPITIQHRYILEDVPCGLVPVEDLAHNCGIDVKNITTVIDLASAVYDIDFRKIGRHISEDMLSEYVK